jgi:ABC-type dipeptide/oligopeptide/nickel transport system ATPase subunit
VRPGDTYGLVGESGCGKSTLLRVLSGLNRHWSGEIEIAGRLLDMEEMDRGMLGLYLSTQPLAA